MKCYKSPATPEDEKIFYQQLIEEIKEKTDYRMSIQEYIIFLKDFIYTEREERSKSAAKSRSSHKRLETPSEEKINAVDFNLGSTNNIASQTIKTQNIEIPPLEMEEEEHNCNFVIVYKGSYRDEEINCLYRLVCSLIPNEESAQKQISDEYKTYETINITLHNISLKNRDPKVFTYSVAEILPDSGGEWMSSNYFELSDELHKRCNVLTGHVNDDFVYPNCVIRTKILDTNKHSQIKFYNFDDPEKPEDIQENKMIQEEKDVVVDNEVVKKEDTSKAKIKEETKDQKVEKKEKNEQKESNIDDLYESMSSITGLDGESFHSFIPSAQIHEEDRKTIEKSERCRL